MPLHPCCRFLVPLQLAFGGMFKGFNPAITRTLKTSLGYTPGGGWKRSFDAGKTILKAPDGPTLELTGEASATLKPSLFFYITPYGVLPVEFGIFFAGTLKLGFPSPQGVCPSAWQVRVEATWGLGATIKVNEPTFKLALWEGQKGSLRFKGWLPIEYSYDFVKDKPWVTGAVPGCFSLAFGSTSGNGYGVPPTMLIKNASYRVDPSPTRTQTRTPSPTKSRNSASAGEYNGIGAGTGDFFGRRAVGIGLASVASQAGESDARVAAVFQTGQALAALLGAPAGALASPSADGGVADSGGPFAMLPDSPVCRADHDSDGAAPVCAYRFGSRSVPTHDSRHDDEPSQLEMPGGWSQPDAACGPALRSRAVECVVSSDADAGTEGGGAGAARVPLSYCKGATGLPPVPPLSVQISQDAPCPLLRDAHADNAANSADASSGAADAAILVSHDGRAHRTVLAASHAQEAGCAVSAAGSGPTTPQSQVAVFAVQLPWATSANASGNDSNGAIGENANGLLACVQAIRLLPDSGTGSARLETAAALQFGAGFSAHEASHAAASPAFSQANPASTAGKLALLWMTASTGAHRGPGPLPADLLSFDGADVASQCIKLTREQVDAIAGPAQQKLFLAVHQPACTVAPAALVGAAAVAFRAGSDVSAGSSAVAVQLSASRPAARFLLSTSDRQVASDSHAGIAASAAQKQSGAHGPAAVALVLIAAADAPRPVPAATAAVSAAVGAGTTRRSLLAAMSDAFRLHDTVALLALAAAASQEEGGAGVSWPQPTGQDDVLAKLHFSDDSDASSASVAASGVAIGSEWVSPVAPSAARAQSASRTLLSSPLLWDPAGCARTADGQAGSCACAGCGPQPALLTLVDTPSGGTVANELAVTVSLTERSVGPAVPPLRANLLAIPVFRAVGRAWGTFSLQILAPAVSSSVTSEPTGPFVMHELRSPVAAGAGTSDVLRHLIVRVRLIADADLEGPQADESINAETAAGAAASVVCNDDRDGDKSFVWPLPCRLRALASRFSISVATGDAASFEFRRTTLQSTGKGWLEAVIPIAQAGLGGGEAVTLLAGLLGDAAELGAVEDAESPAGASSSNIAAYSLRYELDASLVDHAPPYASYAPLALEAGAEHHVMASAAVPTVGAGVDGPAQSGAPEHAEEPLLASLAAPYWYVGVQAEAPRGFDAVVDAAVTMRSSASVGGALQGEGDGAHWKGAAAVSAAPADVDVDADVGASHGTASIGALLTAPSLPPGFQSSPQPMAPYIVLTSRLTRSGSGSLAEGSAARATTAADESSAQAGLTRRQVQAAGASGEPLVAAPASSPLIADATLGGAATATPLPLWLARSSSASSKSFGDAACSMSYVGEDHVAVPDVAMSKVARDACCAMAHSSLAIITHDRAHDRDAHEGDSSSALAPLGSNVSITCAPLTLQPDSSTATAASSESRPAGQLRLRHFFGRIHVFVPASSSRTITITVALPAASSAGGTTCVARMQGRGSWDASAAAANSREMQARVVAEGAAAAGAHQLHFTATNCRSVSRLFVVALAAEAAGGCEDLQGLPLLVAVDGAVTVSKRLATAVAHAEGAIVLAAEAAAEATAAAQAVLSPARGSGCLATVHRWQFTPWSACPVCGGTSTRRVWCADAFSGQPASHKLCAAHDEPATTQACGTPCKFALDDWSPCSPACGPWAQRSRTWRCRTDSGNGTEVEPWRCTERVRADAATETAALPGSTWFTQTVEHALCLPILPCPQQHDASLTASLKELRSISSSSAERMPSPSEVASPSSSASAAPLAEVAAAAARHQLQGLAWRVGDWSACDESTAASGSSISAQLQRRNVACVHVLDAPAVRARLLATGTGDVSGKASEVITTSAAPEGFIVLPETVCEQYLHSPRPAAQQACPAHLPPAVAARLVAAPVYPLERLDAEVDTASSQLHTKAQLLGDQAVTYLLPMPVSVPASATAAAPRAIGMCIRVEAIRSAPAALLGSHLTATSTQATAAEPDTLSDSAAAVPSFSTCTAVHAMALASECFTTLAFCIARSGSISADDTDHVYNATAAALGINAADAGASSASEATAARRLARGLAWGSLAGASHGHPALAGLVTNTSAAASCYSKAQVCLARRVCDARTTLQAAAALASECRTALAGGISTLDTRACEPLPADRWAAESALPLGGPRAAHAAALAVAADAPLFRLLASPARIDTAAAATVAASSHSHGSVADLLRSSMPSSSQAGISSASSPAASTWRPMFPVDDESSVWNTRAVRAVPAASMEAGAAYAVAYLPVLTSAAVESNLGSITPLTSAPLLELGEQPVGVEADGTRNRLQHLFLTVAAADRRGDTNLRISLTAEHILASAAASGSAPAHATPADNTASALLRGPLLSVGGPAVAMAADFGAVPDTAIAAGGLMLTFTLHCDEVLLPSMYGAPFELGGRPDANTGGSRAGSSEGQGAAGHWRSILRLLRAVPLISGQAAPAGTGLGEHAGETPAGWNQLAWPRLQDSPAVRVSPLHTGATGSSRKGRLLSLETGPTGSIAAADIFRVSSGSGPGLAGVRSITVTLPPIPGYAPATDELLLLGLPREYTASGSDVFLGGSAAAPLGLRIRASNRACMVSAFSEWSTCAGVQLQDAAHAHADVQTRSRTVLQEPTGLGAACPPLIESRSCSAAASGLGSAANAETAVGLSSTASAPAGSGSVATMQLAGTDSGFGSMAASSSSLKAVRVMAGALAMALLLASIATAWAPLLASARTAWSCCLSRQQRGARYKRLPRIEPSAGETSNSSASAATSVRPSRRRLARSGAAFAGAALIAVLLATLGTAQAKAHANAKAKRPAWFTNKHHRVFTNAPPTAPLGGSFAPHAAVAAELAADAQRERIAGSRRLSGQHASADADAEEVRGVDPLAHWHRTGTDEGAGEFSSAAASRSSSGLAGSHHRRRLTTHERWVSGQTSTALRQLEHVTALNEQLQRMHAHRLASADAGSANAHADTDIGSRRVLYGHATDQDRTDGAPDSDEDESDINVSSPAHVPLHVLPTSHRYSATLSADTILLDGGVGGEPHPLVLRLVCPTLTPADDGVGRMEVHTVLHPLTTTADGSLDVAAAAAAAADGSNTDAQSDLDLGSLFVHPAHWRAGHFLAGDHRWACKRYSEDGTPAPFQREILSIRKARVERVEVNAGAGAARAAAPVTVAVTVWELRFEEATSLDVLEDLDMSSALTPAAMRAHEAAAAHPRSHSAFMPPLPEASVEDGGLGDARAIARARRLIKIHWGFKGGFDKTFRWEPGNKGALVSSKHFNITCQGCYAQLLLGVKFEARFTNFKPELLDASVTIAPSARFQLVLAARASYVWSKQWELIDPVLLFRLILPAGPIPIPIPIKLHIDALMQLKAEARIILSNVGFAAGYSLTLGARYTPDTGFDTYRIAQPTLEIFKPTLDLYGAVSLRVGPIIAITAGPFDVWNIKLGVQPYGTAYASTIAPACEKDSVQVGLTWGVDAFITIDRPVIRIRLWIIKADIGALTFTVTVNPCLYRAGLVTVTLQMLEARPSHGRSLQAFSCFLVSAIRRFPPLTTSPFDCRV